MRRALLIAALGLAACGPERIPAPKRPVVSAAAGQVCGSNGTTYGDEAEVGAGVLVVYAGPCRRCEAGGCAESEQCVKVPCPNREGSELEAPCLQTTGPMFCMPAR